MKPNMSTTSLPLPAQRPRVLFFGMQSHFSIPSLLALLEQHIEVCAIVLPASPVPGRDPLPLQRREPPHGRRASLPILTMATSLSIEQIAWREQIPLWDVYRLSHKETLKILASYQADIICVACFSLRIPPAVLDIPRLGSLNVHPSLLPANRGPVPLFWTFREGQETTGVTIHMLDEGMDTGDMLAQETIAVPDGISYAELELQYARLGGTLLARTVWNLYEGKATRTPQDETKSYYHSFPSDEDMIVYAEEWDARHVYNFIRGVSQWNGPVTLYEDGNMFVVRDAISYSQIDMPIEAYGNNDGREVVVQCRSGWVKVSVI